MIIEHPNATAAAPGRSLDDLIADFLVDLAHCNRSAHTRRAHAADLARFSSFYMGPVDGITADVLRAFFATCAHLRPATRARTQAALASFYGWAYRHELIETVPMARVERVRPDPPQVRGLAPRSSASWPPFPRRRCAITCSSASSLKPACGVARRWDSTSRIWI